MKDLKRLPAEPLRAYLVDIDIRVRVLATSEEEAKSKAIQKALNDPKEYICENNMGLVDEDREVPLDQEDMEFLLFPSLDPLTPTQIEQARIAFEQNQDKLSGKQKA